MRLIGLTGGIATGKTTVAEMLGARGALVVDADRLAREVVEPGTPALAAIVAEFGEGVLDAEGRLFVTSQATRNQARNVEDARAKVASLVAAALREPRARRASRPPAGARERRLESKKRRAALKRARTRMDD